MYTSPLICLQVRDALFFVEIADAEGEFALGLVRRTFDETPQQLADGDVRVHWYQRISRNHSWGRQPSFKPCMCSAGGRARRPTPFIELVSKESFLSIPILLTRQSRLNLEKPVLSQDCMAYLRTVEVSGIEEEDGEAQEVQEDKAQESTVDSSDQSDHGEAGPSLPVMKLARGRRVLDSSDEEGEHTQKVKESSKKKAVVLEPHHKGGGPTTRPGGKRRRSARS